MNNFNLFNYLCNNEYLNQIIINLNFDIKNQEDDYLTYNINFLKTISNKINIDSLKLIFHIEYNIFPLLDQILILLNNEDIMIRNSARNIFLSLIKLNYPPLIEYLCDIPRISIFIILVQKIKSYILLMINLNDNNKKFYAEKTKELKEKISEDLLFIQDILSINIEKINYILINCLFSILFIFIFGKIISFLNNPNNTKIKSEVAKSINILILILKNIKNEGIKNLLCFLIFSDKISLKINNYLKNLDYFEKKEYNLENLRLLDLNYQNFNYNFSNLEFEDYIILNYSQNFLKSIKYINRYSINKNKINNEIINIYNYIKQNNQNIDEEKVIQIINNNYLNNKKNILINMYNYHYFISKRTGINCGICNNGEKESFGYIIYNYFLLFQSNIIINNNLNFYYQNNILRKGILMILGIEIENRNNNDINSIMNIVFLLIQIIYDKDISEGLKRLMNIKKVNENKEIINNQNQKNNIKVNYLLEGNNNNIYNINNDSNINKIPIYPDYLPNPVNKGDFSKLNNDNINFIFINEQKIDFKDLNYDHNFFSKIKSNLYNINNNDEIIINIINFLFNQKYDINNINIILCFNLIENLMNESNKLNINQNSSQIFDIINYYYITTLKEIKDILFKNGDNNNIKNEIFKYSYGLFEECFYLLQKDIKEIINNYDTELQSSYIIIENSPLSSQKFKLKCLFQKFIYLHDLQLILESNNNKNLLFKNISFPLKIIKDNSFNIGGKINLKEYGINTVDVYFIKNFEKNNNFLNEIKESLTMFVYHNYLFFALSQENNINDINSEEYSFIKYRYALRNIIFKPKIEMNEIIISFNGNDSKNKILLIFQNNLFYKIGLNFIVNGINSSIKLEYSLINSFINDYASKCYRNNK